MTGKNDDYPSIPFQYSLREMKKYFYLWLDYSDDKVYAVKFRPADKSQACFSGEVWVDAETFSPIRINLRADNTSKHPFLPFSTKDTLSGVTIAISHTYTQDGNNTLLSHINFDYHLTYKSVRDSASCQVPSVLSRNMDTKGVIYCYDYEDPFILPFFDYDADYDDYRKMSVIPYNEVFWNNNNSLLLTEKQKENLGFFAREGHLVNYREGNYGRNFLNIPGIDTVNFYEFYYCFWSAGKRISLNKKLLQNQIFSQDKINQSIRTDLCNLKVQILLDVTQLPDSLNFKTYTVFDAKQTFYHLPEYAYTNAFLNIYFDICEFERRKFEKELFDLAGNISTVQKMYAEVCLKLEKLKQQYLQDVGFGRNEKEMMKWNKYIYENSGIDNLKLYNPYGPDIAHPR
jgi:hypothetical protein